MVAAGPPTVVVGAGPAGLATAAALTRAGRAVTLLEQATQVGASWAARYDSLHLHTIRWLSGLPGFPIPRAYGRWVARDDVVRYLGDYAEFHGLQPRLGVALTRIDRVGEQWRLATSDGVLVTGRVVLATGYSHTPRRPELPGAQNVSG